MYKKINWFKVEFYDRNTGKERFRTVKVPVAKYGSVLDTLRRKIEACGFSNFYILQYYITSRNYLA